MDEPLFHVKICGVTTPADARLAAEAGADAIGFNFVSGSPRRVDPDTAREAIAGLPAGVLPIGVFAGTAAAEILEIARHAGLRAVQLHGHLEEGPAFDPPDRCRELPGLDVIRAVRLAAPATRPPAQPPREQLPAGPGPRDAAHQPAAAAADSSRRRDPPAGDPLEGARRWLTEAVAAGRGPAMVIVDAGAAAGTPAGLLGGTGRLVDWGVLAAQAPLGPPVALAGGLTPENVARAIRAARVRAVDTASGVEESPGRKNPARMRAFVAAARAALHARH